jgi:hypothetical protein
MQLAYLTPDCALPLDGSVDPETLARYLAGSLKVILPPRAPEPPPLPPSSQKVKLPVLLSKRVIKEAQALADAADRSLNWALQQGWIHARARMRAAVRADSQPHD